MSYHYSENHPTHNQFYCIFCKKCLHCCGTYRNDTKITICETCDRHHILPDGRDDRWPEGISGGLPSPPPENFY